MARQLTLGTRYPALLPRDYVPRTLARLLPPEDVIQKLSAAQIAKLWEYRARLTQLIEEDPTKFLIPNRPGQRAYLECNDDKIIGRFFFAGNKAGKTTGTAVALAERMVGRALWGHDEGRAGLTWPTPARAVWYTEDFSSHEETIVPTYLTWCPKAEIARVTKNQNGTANFILHTNGSVIYLRSYEQGISKPEGKDYDYVAFDEPPPREIYIGCVRGLVARGGKVYIGATLLKEAWLYDELQHPFNMGFSGEIYDNPWLDIQTLAAFEATLDDTERLVRIHGKPITLTGLIYPEFSDREPFVIEHKRPYDPQKETPYPIIMAVDPHERKPLFVEWAWVLPDDSILWFDWDLVPSGDFEEIFDRIKQKELAHESKSVVCIMDPNRGGAIGLGGTSWEDQFNSHGYSVILGDDELNIGHTQTRHYLRQGLMRWTTACRGKGGPIYFMQRYSWDDWQRRLRDKKTTKETPKETFKDWPDLHRYTAMAGLTFDTLTHLEDTIDLTNNQKRKPIRAYN